MPSLNLRREEPVVAFDGAEPELAGGVEVLVVGDHDRGRFDALRLRARHRCAATAAGRPVELEPAVSRHDEPERRHQAGHPRERRRPTSPGCTSMCSCPSRATVAHILERLRPRPPLSDR